MRKSGRATPASAQERSMSAATLSSVRYSSTLIICNSGLMSRSLSDITSVLGRPTVEQSASSCRFRLLSETLSESMIIIRPTPARAVISAAYAPTPPRPATTTVALFRACKASPPTSRAVRSSHAGLFSGIVLRIFLQGLRLVPDSVHLRQRHVLQRLALTDSVLLEIGKAAAELGAGHL